MLMQPLKIISSLAVFILVFITTGYSQTPVKKYEKEWKNIDELITKKKLPKTALTEVKKIYTLAKKRKAGGPDHKGCGLYDRAAKGNKREY